MSTWNIRQTAEFQAWFDLADKKLKQDLIAQSEKIYARYLKQLNGRKEKIK